MFSIGAFALVFDKHNRILLCHRRDVDLWNLPGGGVERGELPTETAVRETKEETGLDVVVKRLVGVYGKTDRDEFVFAFVCDVVGGRLTMTAEADQHCYFAVEDIPANTIPRQVERIHDALQAGTQPVFCFQAAVSAREWLDMLNSQKGEPNE